MAEAASARFPAGVRPFEALAAVLRLMRDKEATHEAFRISAALDGPVAERLYRRFAASEAGARVLAERVDLSRVLSDRPALAALPAGSLGRAYLDFTSREGLSPEGFQAEMDATGESFEGVGEDRQRFSYRLRHAHDLYHVLTGYGRDLLGELSVLAFTHAQTRAPSLLLMMAFGLVKAGREYPGLPALACLREGGRLGRAAGDLVCADWEGLLALPLEGARRQLGVGVPLRYVAIQRDAETLDRRYRAGLAAERV